MDFSKTWLFVHNNFVRIGRNLQNEVPVEKSIPAYVASCKYYSGASARAKRARSGAPWVRKFGKLSIRENLVMT